MTSNCKGDAHVWSNDFGDDWTPDVGMLCDCRQKQWGVPIVAAPARGSLTTLAWARERLANSQRIADRKIGEDRASWLEDVAYWQDIVTTLEGVDRLTGERAWQPIEVAVIAQLVDGIETVPVVEFCECSRPRSEHQFWNDRIYDVQGLKCPGRGRWDGEYRFSSSLTAVRHREARIAKATEVLAAAALPPPPEKP